MKKFSERLGIVESTPFLQTDSMSTELRNSLWNVFVTFFGEVRRENWNQLSRLIAQFFRKVPLDELPYGNNDCLRWVKEYFFSLEWYRALANYLMHQTVAFGARW